MNSASEFILARTKGQVDFVGTIQAQIRVPLNGGKPVKSGFSVRLTAFLRRNDAYTPCVRFGMPAAL
jgi:hypothetical protein